MYQDAQPPRRTHHWLLMGGCLIVLGASYAGSRQLDLGHRAHATAAQAPETAATPAENTARFAAKVNALIAANPSIDISVSLVAPNGTSTHYGVDAGYQAASTAKLLTAAAYLHGVEQGTYSLDDRIGDSSARSLLQSMIVDSDDDSWVALNNTVGYNGLASYANSLGITDYDSAGNILTSGDIALLLQKLQAGSLLNGAHRQLLLSYMKQANYRDFIVAGAPGDVTVYHKAGETDDEVHDAAILTKGSRSMVLVIYTNGHGTYDWDARSTLIQQITAAATQNYLE